VGDSPRRPPTSVFVVAALALLTLGATWWMGADSSQAAPPARADLRAPVGSVIVLRLDDGRILTYESGRSVISERTASHRLCWPGLRPLYPSLRSVGQDNISHC
jgi:hypothetical protein